MVIREMMERRRSNTSLITSPCRLGSTSSAIRTETLNTSWLNDYKVEDTIGRGKFAVVKRCSEKSTGQQYAAKCIRKRRHNRDCTPDILHEIAVLEMGINHPHLIKLHKVYETPSEFVLILEYAAGGEIFDHCVGVKETFSEETSRRLMKQILEAVHFLHSNDVVHLDLKPQNILLSKDGSDPDSAIKLVDFGLSKYITADLEIREILGTPDYVAPEVLNYEPLSTATDIWSLGVVAYVMLTGVSPFLGDTKQDTLMNVTTAVLDFPPDLFDSLSPYCRDFMKKMLQRDPIDRCSAHQSMSHPWITGEVVPETPLKALEENGHEDVFVNGDSTDEKGSAVDEENYQNGETNDCAIQSETVVNSAPDPKLSVSLSQESDVDYNGNILDENTQCQADSTASTPKSCQTLRDSLLSTPTSCQTLSDLSVISDDSNGSSVDVDNVTTVRPINSCPDKIRETPTKSSIQNSSTVNSNSKTDLLSRINSESLSKCDLSPSPKITSLSLSSQPTSPCKLPKDKNAPGTSVDSSMKSESDQSVPLCPCGKGEQSTSVDPISKNTSNNNIVSSDTCSMRSADPCLKRRKYDYRGSTDQNSTEISVAD